MGSERGTVESIIPLREIGKIWLRKWLVLAVAFVICGIGWTAVFLIQDKYESMARVYLDTQSMLKPVLKGLAIENDVRAKVAETTRRTLLSRANLERVINETDLGLAVTNSHQKERLIASLRSKIKISGAKKNNIYIITFQHTDAEIAKIVVEKLLDMFMETALGVVRKDSSMTENFIDDQIKDYEERLLEAENVLKKFKRDNVGLMPTEAGGYFQRLSKEIENLDNAKIEFNEVQKRRDVIAAQISGEAPLVNSNNDQGLGSVANPFDARINSLNERLDDLLVQYTEGHPDVISITQAIERLEVQKEEAYQVGNDGENKQLVSQSPIYQELKVMLAKTEAELSALSERKSAYQARVANLQRYIDKIPKVEAELSQLNRDYDINKRNYETLVDRREAAKISREAEKSVDNVQFQVIDMPIVPLVPVSPNRPILISLVLLAGLGAGVGLAWLLSLLRPTLDDPKEVAEVLDLPILGGVSLVYTETDKKWKKIEMVGFFAAFCMLLGIYGVIVIVEKLNINLF